MPRENESQLVFKRGRTTLAAILRVVLRSSRLKVRTCIPATVVSYNATTQRARIRFDVLTKRHTTRGAVKNPPQILDLPVHFPRTSFGYLAFPVFPDDKGHVIVCDRAIQTWMENGGLPDDPGLLRTHNWMDGIFEPGLHPNDKPISGLTANDAVVLEGILIKLGAGATQAAVLGTAFSTLYNDLVTKFNAHIHVTTATDPAEVIGVLSPPVLQASPMVAGVHTSTKVLIE